VLTDNPEVLGSPSPVPLDLVVKKGCGAFRTAVAAQSSPFMMKLNFGFDKKGCAVALSQLTL